MSDGAIEFPMFPERRVHAFIPGEEASMLRFSARRLMRATQRWVEGELTLTALRLLFEPHDCSTYKDAGTHPSIEVALGNIYRVARVDLGPPLLQCVLRSGVSVVFALPKKKHARSVIVDHWRKHCLLPFAVFRCNHGPPLENPPIGEVDWLREGYERCLGSSLREGSLRLSTINADYSVCTSYPSLVVVPSSVTDDQLRESAEFRSGKRFPAVVWRHSGSGALLVRCAQPMGGLAKRSAADERLVEAVKEAAGSLVLIDSRPVANAVAHKLVGKGSERSENYGGCEVRYAGLANIHGVRESWQRLMNLCQKAESDDDAHNDNWLVALHDTQWLHLVRHLLEGAKLAAKVLDLEGRSCVTHCSDGWDRTSALCSLVQLMLDPFCRTMAGFARLVHREWICFGHRFQARLGIGVSSTSESSRESSPVFLLFCDCVHQMVRQFPRDFEFGSEHQEIIRCETLADKIIQDKGPADIIPTDAWFEGQWMKISLTPTLIPLT